MVNQQNKQAENKPVMIGNKMNFAAAEAYKRLRTNLLFSIAGEEKCRVIGVTSSLKGEGKSTTSINLAYTLAEAGKRVLLLDADMRMSNVHKVLKIQPAPGLSNLLVGLNNTHFVQPSGIHKNLSVITAGDVPPNPSELLSAKRMQAVLSLLSEKMDFIIIDLPPVDAVADALIVSKLTDGMVVVVRQNYVDKRVLDNTVRQLRFHNANILGFVVNCTEIEKKYYKKSYYKDYRSTESNDND